ncbi:MAG: SDR family NAD(P)-dependent oxidoreductase [Gammaproteobacteria bacterium]
MDIQGQAAIITGGASGMGAATAEKLVEQGAKVCLLDKNYQWAQDMAKKLKGHAIACDVADNDSVEQALRSAEELQGKARICINCAGIASAGRIVGREGPMAMADFNRVIEVNLLGTFNVMRLAAASMMQLDPLGKSQARGIIINTASIAAYDGQIGQAAYSAAKGAIVSLTLPAAREFAKFGIRVNTIAPGLIATPMLADMPESVRESLVAQTQFPKRLGYPQEYAKLVAHMIDNELINGEVIRLDGAVRLAAK